MATKRYLCPRHFEKTPSAIAYHDGFKCFGCGAYGPLTELGLAPNEKPEISYVEDLTASVSYIESLPRKLVRGFELPYNARGYYLVWPDASYYKFRQFNDNAVPKYRGPSGHKKPPFCVQKRGAKQLALVEGEFNALSLKHVNRDWDIISPGGAGDFVARGRNNYLQEYCQYENIYLMLDADHAGATHGIECSSKLQQLGAANVKIILLERDFNDVYVKEGQEGLQKYVNSLGV